jgi:hypothetical protein
MRLHEIRFRVPIRAARLACLALLAAALPLAAAETPSVETIVEETNRVAYYQGKDGRAQVNMAIVDAQGNERTRTFVILRRDGQSPDADATGGQKYYVYFLRPADIKQTVFLVWKHLGEDDDRWLYQPALDLVKRIAASDKRTSFVGSHFYYEDVSGRATDLDEHTLEEVTDTYYVLRNVPKDPEAVEFSHYLMYIHKESFVTVQTEYYDKSGEKYRVYTATSVETIDGYPTVVESVMKDLAAGGETRMRYGRVSYDVGLPEEIFTERYLRNPPRQYLR